MCVCVCVCVFVLFYLLRMYILKGFTVIYIYIYIYISLTSVRFEHSVCHESLLASCMYSRFVVLQTLHHVPENHYGINLYLYIRIFSGMYSHLKLVIEHFV